MIARLNNLLRSLVGTMLVWLFLATGSLFLVFVAASCLGCYVGLWLMPTKENPDG